MKDEVVERLSPDPIHTDLLRSLASGLRSHLRSIQTDGRRYTDAAEALDAAAREIEDLRSQIESMKKRRTYDGGPPKSFL